MRRDCHRAASVSCRRPTIMGMNPRASLRTLLSAASSGECDPQAIQVPWKMPMIKTRCPRSPPIPGMNLGSGPAPILIHRQRRMQPKTHHGHGPRVTALSPPFSHQRRARQPPGKSCLVMIPYNRSLSPEAANATLGEQGALSPPIMRECRRRGRAGLRSASPLRASLPPQGLKGRRGLGVLSPSTEAGRAGIQVKNYV